MQEAQELLTLASGRTNYPQARETLPLDVLVTAWLMGGEWDNGLSIQELDMEVELILT